MLIHQRPPLRDLSHLYTSPVKSFLSLASGEEVVESDLNALRHGLLSLTNPDAGVVVLLVRLVFAFGVADLGLEVAAL